MKKKLVLLFICVLTSSAVFAGCGKKEDNSKSGRNRANVSTEAVVETAESTSSDVAETVSSEEAAEVNVSTETVPEVDTDIEQDSFEIYISHEENEYSEFVIIYEDKNGILSKMTDECHFYKDLPGIEWDLEFFESYDIDASYPGYSQMSFTETNIEERDDCFLVQYTFNDLNVTENLRAVVDSGIIPKPEPEDALLIKASAVRASVLNAGFKTVAPADYEKYNLDYSK